MHFSTILNKPCIVVLLFLAQLTVNGQPRNNKPNALTQVSSVNSAYINPTPAAYSSGLKVSYIRTKYALGAITDTAIFNTANYQSVKEMTSYFDGLGRPLQNVIRQASPGVKDLVSPIIYDELGREVYKYLPYVSTGSTGDGKLKMNPFYDQGTFYTSATLNPGCVGEQAFYSKTNFEPSSYTRVLKSLSPGNSWVGASRGIEMQYLVNSTLDSVRIWTINNDTLTYVNNDSITNIPLSNSLFGAGQLYKNVVKDEQGNATVEYKNMEGLLILKKVQIGTIAADFSGYSGFLSTYFVYDDFNRLRFVMQPKCVAQLLSSNWVLSDSIVKELCYRYEFDTRSRMIAKKAPGASWIYNIYDNRDRLVFSQDGIMRLTHPVYNSKMWTTNLYDSLNRQVMTGIYLSNNSPNDMQRYVAGLIDGTSNVSYTTDSVVGGVPTMVDMPIYCSPVPASSSNFFALTVTFYDDYEGAAATYSSMYSSKLTSGSNTNVDAVPSQSSLLTTGNITRTWVRVLKDPNNLHSGNMLSTTTFYDDKGRVIQVQADNYKGGKDTTAIRYNFTGFPVSKYEITTNPSSAFSRLAVTTFIEYDHANRVLEIKKQVNDDAANLRSIVKIDYDELGNIRTSKLGQVKSSTNTWTTTPIETLDYRYNIRNWIKSINYDYANNSGTNNSNRWFGQELNYDWGFDSVQYNGNITGVKWRTKGDGLKRAYGYTYDKASRIMGADYSTGTTTYNDYSVEKFDMQMGNGQLWSSAYDENGNIKVMKQWGYNLTTSSVIDDLTYSYISNSNKLLNVIDATNNPTTKLGDFRTSILHPASGSKNSSTVDYSYDLNGNLVKDLNKDIGSSTVAGIQYNHLNLPSKITVNGASGIKGTITYYYDATGLKLEKRVQEDTIPDKVTTYLNGAVFEKDSLQFITHEEGRVRYAKKYFVSGDSANQFIYDYFVKDQLGNVRMVLTEQSDTAKYFATMEATYRQKEDKLFYNIPQSSYPVSLVPGGYPTDNTTSPNDSLIRLNGSVKTIGPGIVLKVMGGDKIDIGSKYFFRPNSNPGSITNPLVDILSSLASGIITLSGELKGTYSALTNTSTSPLLAAANALINSSSTPNTQPSAGLCWISFDEHFTKINTGFISNYAPDAIRTLAATNIPVSNGYLYIFVMNRTQNWDVFFDNLSITHQTGALLEETHYYPFGLTMAGISTTALKPHYTENKIKFQGQEISNKEFSDGSGLEGYEFKWRMDDPQIGRFWQIDPLADKYVHNSTYAFSENKVTAHVELEGLESITIQDLWRGGGITSSTDPKQFVKDVGKEALKPRNWVEATAATSQIVGPVFLTTLMTGGFGDGAVLSAETNALRAEASAGSTIAQNAARGKDFEQVVVGNLAKEGHTNIAEQVTIKAANGIKTRVDAISASAEGNLALTDAKSSSTAPLTKNQKLAYPSIAQNGGVVVGKGKPGYPGGMTIPPTQVDIVRPSSMQGAAADATYVKPPVAVVVPLTRKRN